MKTMVRLISKRIIPKNKESYFNPELQDFFKKNYNIEHQSITIIKIIIFQV